MCEVPVRAVSHTQAAAGSAVPACQTLKVTAELVVCIIQHLGRGFLEGGRDKRA